PSAALCPYTTLFRSNARRGLRSVPRPEESATVWSGLEDVDPEPRPGEGGEDTSAQGGQASGPGATGAPEVLDDPDREAALEHSAGSDDEGEDVFEDLDHAVPEDEAPDGAEPGSGSSEEPAADGGEASSDAVPPSYQDTVDLTPLPGFDD